MRLFTTVLKLFGLRACYALGIPVAIVCAFISPDIAATMDFHQRAFGHVPFWKRRWLVFRHYYSFGIALIDRLAILAGEHHRFSFTFDGEEHLRDAVAEGNGVLLLTAHLGNWEAAGQLLTRLDVPINVTGFDKEAAATRAQLDQAANANFRLIPLTGSPTDAIPLVAAMRRGEIVAMLGDRAYSSAAARVPILGEEAPFPVGAYVMAAAAKAPLVHVFSMRESGGHYHFFGFPAERPEMPAHHERDAYLRQCAQSFADNLESVLKRDPLQWYNFYAFWNAPDKPAASQSEPTTCPAT